MLPVVISPIFHGLSPWKRGACICIAKRSVETGSLKPTSFSGSLKPTNFKTLVLRNCNLYGRIPAYVGKAGTHLWKEIKHDNTVTWLAFWNDPINPKEFKYVFLAASSSLKGQSDREIRESKDVGFSGLVCGVCWLTDELMPRFECRLVGRWNGLVNRFLILFVLADGSYLSVSQRWKSCSGLDDGRVVCVG